MTTPRPKRRAPTDRLLDLSEGAMRGAMRPETLRKLHAGPNPPPLFKVNGRWKVWQSDLDAWLDGFREVAG